MDDQQFRQLLSRFGSSWDGYRKVRKGVKKRISRHMQQMGCRTLQAYFSELDHHEDAKQRFESLMTVSISRFFRDRGVWRLLEDAVLPGMIEEDRDALYVWSAGCGCGEEVYSLKILWHEMKRGFQSVPELKMWATDMNPAYLGKAQAGVYTASSLGEVPDPFRMRYFELGGKEKRYAIAEPLKQGIVWLKHNLLSDPPPGKFQLVFLRNGLLTYYDHRLKAPAFEKVLDSLAPNGFLVIGTHEKIPQGAYGLMHFADCQHILQKEAERDSGS
jgi:chemotaxis methyl-accepting protein methylase